MDLSHPMQSVIPSAHGAVLTVLADTMTPLSGRSIASLTRPAISQRRVNDVLTDLATHGIASRQRVGSAYVYGLNRGHLATPGIIFLAGMRADLLARMRRLIADWQTPAQAAWLFGSAARGMAGPDSDVDLLVVRPPGADEDAWEAQTTDLAECVFAWTGNQCDLLDLSSDELAVEVASGGRLVTDLRDHGIPLAEGDHRGLIRRAA